MKEFQEKVMELKCFNELINKSYTKAIFLFVILGKVKKKGFILEKFLYKNNFKTIFNENNYPIMIYPTKLADSIIKN